MSDKEFDFTFKLVATLLLMTVFGVFLFAVMATGFLGIVFVPMLIAIVVVGIVMWSEDLE